MSTVDADATVPELVPARMVNEFAYCPRLFFLEWVQARFTDNADTVEGRYQHRAVDRERGAAPLPDDGEVRAARSLLLSSPRLGLTARVDILEGVGGAVRPVDVKRGSPPNIPEQAWEPERVQLCVQGLLLREAGYTCDEGILYFAEARRRVSVPFDEALIARTLRLVEELRAVAAHDLAPPPWSTAPSAHAARWSASACRTRPTRSQPAARCPSAGCCRATPHPGRCTSPSRARPSACGPAGSRSPAKESC